MNSNRLPLVGLVVMIIIAVFALALQQQAVNDVRAQMTRVASSDNDRGTAVAMAQAATGTLAQVESGQATALAAAQGANTAQATAQSAAGTAAARLEDEGTRSAQFAATTTANAESVQATVTMHANDVATLQAESTAEVATLQGQLVGQATTQADLQGQLGTATAQVDLAEFARKAAEDDRTNALNQLWALGTRQADSSSQLATAQVILTGAPPATAAPRPTAVPEIDVTSVNNDATATNSNSGELNQTFQTSDKKVQLNYPDGWIAQETQNGSIILGSEEAVLTRKESVLSKGQVQIEILIGTYDQFNFNQGTAPTDLLNGVVGAVKSNQAKFTAGTAEAITLGDYNGAQALGSDGENDVTLILVELSDTTIGVAFASSASGEGANSLDTLTAIMGSIAYVQ